MRIRVPVDTLGNEAKKIDRIGTNITQGYTALNKGWKGLELDTVSRVAVERRVNQARSIAGTLISETNSLSKYVSTVGIRFAEVDGKEAQRMATAYKAVLHAPDQQKGLIERSVKDFEVNKWFLLILSGVTLPPVMALSYVKLKWLKQRIFKNHSEYCLLRGDQSRPCSISKTKDGTKIISPSDKDIWRQNLTRKRVAKFWDEMPAVLSKHTSEIQILDYRNPDDQYWAEKLDRPISLTRSMATAGFGEIHIYEQHILAGSSHYDIPGLGDQGLSATLYHEAAHNFDRGMSGGDSWFSDSEVWKEAVGSDDRGFVSPYAQASYEGYVRDNSRAGHYVEDFADSVKLYYLDREVFKHNFPNRYEVLRGVMEAT